MLKKFVIYYTRKNLNVFLKIGYIWFEIIIILKDETLNLQKIKTLSKLLIYSKMMKKKTCHVLKQL